jgi:hypothetical protein
MFIYKSKLPPFMFQLIDHIFISDSRGLYFSSGFECIINTTDIKEKGIIINTILPDKVQLSIKKTEKGYERAENCVLLSKEMKKASDLHKKILLYSDDYSESCLLFITYVTTQYHFTKRDIEHMIVSSIIDHSLKEAMIKVLSIF